MDTFCHYKANGINMLTLFVTLWTLFVTFLRLSSVLSTRSLVCSVSISLILLVLVSLTASQIEGGPIPEGSLMTPG